MKLATVEKKTFLAGLQCTLTSSCAKSEGDILETLKIFREKSHNAEKTERETL